MATASFAKRKSFWVCSGWLVVCLLLPLPALLPAADRKAILHLKDPAVAGVTIPFVEVTDLKLNGEKKLRIGTSPTYSRDVYRRLRDLKFDDMQNLQWSENSPGQIQIQTNTGQAITCYCVPDGIHFSSAMQTVTGEAMQGAILEGNFLIVGKRNKRQIPMKAVRKIYFVPETARLDEMAFRGAEGQNTIAAWKEFVGAFPGSTLIASARANLTKAYLTQAADRLERFQKGGPLAALREGAQLAAEALKVTPQDQEGQQLKASMEAAEKDLFARVANVQGLVGAKQWDQALEAVKPLLHLGPEIAEIPQLQQRSLEGSHQLHREQGLARLKAGELEVAVNEFRLALERMPNAESTRQELREAEIQLDLKTAAAALSQTNYEAAHDLLSRNIEKHGADQRTAELLDRVKSQWAEKLFRESVPLYSVLESPVRRAATQTAAPTRAAAARKGQAPVRKLDSPKVEADFIAALKLLEKAHELVASPKTETPIGQIRDSLAGYYLQLATKKLNAPKGAGIAQAYLYAQRARSYQANLPGVAEALDQAREGMRQKSSIGVNIMFQDGTTRKNADSFARELAARVGEAVQKANLPGVKPVERGDFELLTKEAALGQKFSTEGGMSLNVKGAGVQVLGTIFTYEARPEKRHSQPSSRYISGYRDNPDYSRLQALAADLEPKVAYWEPQARDNECTREEDRAGIVGPCKTARRQAAAQRDEYQRRLYDVQAQLQRTQPQFPVYSTYQYSRLDVSVQAQLRADYRFVDTVTGIRMQQKVFQDRKEAKGTEIDNVQPTDTNNLQNRHDPIPDEGELLRALEDKMFQQIAEDTVKYLRDFSTAYVNKARAARDRRLLDDATEYFILFAYTSPSKSSREYREAVEFLKKERNLEVAEADW